MGNIFAEMQQMSMSESPISEARRSLTELTNYMRSLDFQQEQLGFFSELRKLELSTLNTARCFMVPDDLPVKAIPDEYQHDSFGFVLGSRIIYSGRLVLPVCDVHGEVAGFTGYDKFEEPKYLDSLNYGYKAKRTMLFGMENLPKYYNDGYVIVPEGPMCSLWLRENNFNSMALLGSYISPYVAEILKRFGRRCIVVPDTDETGNKLKKQVRLSIPEAQVWQMTKAKDIDDSRKSDNPEEEKILSETLRTEISNKLRNPFTRTTMIA